MQCICEINIYFSEISSLCAKFVLPSLCFSAFPICSDRNEIHRYQHQYINKKSLAEKQNKTFRSLRNQIGIFLQRICKEDCILLETELCSREYAIAKRHPIISKFNLLLILSYSIKEHLIF